jgi:uroporphyrinogen decarboxylase
VSEPLLVRALRRDPVECTPVWFMRQAGRSLPEYRALREWHPFFELASTPELCAEVTLQPVRRHGVDAAVLFADIMTPVLGMGVELELVEGVGPVLDRPIASAADVARLRIPEPEEAFAAVLEAVRIVRRELEPERALIGFCGGPFTVAGYLVEGRPSRDFVGTKELMYREPDVWHALMDRLAESFAGYVAATVSAGADVIQLFDSWVGALTVSDYEEFVAPYSARVLAAVDVPAIHFGTGTAHLLGSMAAAGGDAIGLDWRVPLDQGWLAVGPDKAVQGNLDPAVLLGPWERIEAAALDVLARAGGRPGHVFNLGHGVLPETDPEHLTRLAELVHQRTTGAWHRSEPVPGTR